MLQFYFLKYQKVYIKLCHIILLSFENFAFAIKKKTLIEMHNSLCKSS